MLKLQFILDGQALIARRWREYKKYYFLINTSPLTKQVCQCMVWKLELIRPGMDQIQPSFCSTRQWLFMFSSNLELLNSWLDSSSRWNGWWLKLPGISFNIRPSIALANSNLIIFFWAVLLSLPFMVENFLSWCW